ncbi:RDD family protein [Lentibacillus sp.]|jgi:uncharacterized RDD family membrane protein YckC|uniref:RDD family protein n=1 Tax=Lentibacillus sp. TaxID=1925746 RepID=UPI002B4B307C|nr:RDD family protein [Lentibacillus sp.]HLS09874.1 RDD family protein [Lentibacillus sp.]
MNEYQPAGFWIRFWANLLDGIFMMLLYVVIALAIGENLAFGQLSDPDYVSVSQDVADLIYIVVFIIIFTASKYKGSPGKLITGIQVLDKDRMTQISILKSIGRWFAYLLSALPFFIGFMMAGWNDEKKALHDMICGTRVIYRDR